MDFSILLEMLANAVPIVRVILEIIGLVLGAVVTIIALTPYKGDDKVLEDIKKLPLVGNLLAALIKFSPFSKK